MNKPSKLAWFLAVPISFILCLFKGYVPELEWYKEHYQKMFPKGK